MKALCFDSFGGPEVLYFGDVPEPVTGDHDLLVKTKAIGLNFADVHRRNGNYHLVGKPPFIAGYEGAGEVVKVGKAITNIKIGDRIGFADVPLANAQLVAVPYEKAIPLPAAITYETAAAALLQGLTAQYLTHDSYAVKPGDVALVHSAAGGVGLLLVQLCKHLGATTIGLTSSPQKELAIIDAGADKVFLYNNNWREQVSSLGINVVYESMGTTLTDSMAVTKEGGTIVFFGFAAGDPPLVDPRYLMDRSLTLTGGDLWGYLTSREERLKRSAWLFNWITNGNIEINISKTFALQDGAAAHAFLESRQSTGKVLLIP